MLQRLVPLDILIQRHQQPRDRLLAHLHRARDPALLRLAARDQLGPPGDEPDRGAAERLAAGVGHEVHPRLDVAAQVLLRRRVDDQRHAGRVRQRDAALQRQRRVGRGVVRLHEEKRRPLPRHQLRRDHRLVE